MESKEDIPALHVNPHEIGLIKEEPCMRWAKGQDIWDNKFKSSAVKANLKRDKIKVKAERMISNARDQGLRLTSELHGEEPERQTVSRSEEKADGTIQVDRRYGPLDLDDEHPPPTAIAKRRDTVRASILPV